jgi:Leucine-rich repeat (LRR) protein
MSLTTLRLDNNALTFLVPQVGNLKLLEELSVSSNRLFEIPNCLGENLTQLVTLNIADNCIKALPASLGNLGKYSLKMLYLHGNSFTSFPSSFLHMCNLEELSLEWFLYAKPSKPKLVRRTTEDGLNVFESLEQLFNLLVKHSMNECMLIIFLEYYSVEEFEVNFKDNR